MTDPIGLEAALARAAQRPRFLAGPADTSPATPARLASNLAAIEAELDAPRPSRLARMLGHFGVDEATIPLVTATPALRRSWIFSVLIGVFFALAAASSSTAAGVDRIIVFLTAAPLVPLVGVALAFGPGVDPTHEVAVAAPMDGFRLFLVRAVTVVSTSTGVLLVASILAPTGGLHRIAWLLPSLAATVITMALATKVDPRLAAGIVAAGWITLVIVISNVGSTSAAFGPVVQLASVPIAALALVVLVRRRHRLDLLVAGT